MAKRKNMRWLKLALGIVLSSKAALLGAYYMGSRNPSFSRRIEDSLFYDNVPIAKGSFPDPAGLEIRIEINEHGAKETYLYHNGEKKYSIAYDLLPKDSRMVNEALEKRIGTGEGSTYIEPDENTRLAIESRKLKWQTEDALKAYEDAIADFRKRSQGQYPK